MLRTSLLALLAASFASLSLAASIDRLSVNGRVNPLGIGADDVSFAWSTASHEPDFVQRGYEIRVGTAEGSSDVWDSGRVDSDRQIDVTLPADKPLLSARRYYWQVKVWDAANHATPWSAPAWFETALIAPADWSGASWISAAPASTVQNKAAHADSLPLLRGVARLAKPIRSGRIYASAHGIYQLSINGQKVGEQYLAPGWTDYRRRTQAQTYDVTRLLRGGENVIGAVLGEGWFRGKVGLGWSKVYGDRLALVAKLRVTYTDGSTEDFGTNQSWRFAGGPYVRGDLQDGETYDARRERLGWNQPGFDVAGWSPVAVVSDDVTTLVPQPDERSASPLPWLRRTALSPRLASMCTILVRTWSAWHG